MGDSPESSPGVRLRPLTDGVWLHVSEHRFENGARYTSNGLVVREGGYLVLVDSAWGDEKTAMLLDEIQSAIGLPVRLAVATHSHDDRAAGARIMRERGIRFYGFSITRMLMTARGDTPPPHTLDMASEAGSVARFGPVEVFFPGAAHTTDNLVVWLPRQRLLFGGCAVREANSTSLGYYKEGDPANWAHAMALVKARYSSATIVVPGHGKVGDIGLLDHTATLATEHLALHEEQAPEH